MRTLTVNFSYTINGSEQKEFETELDGSQTIEDIKTEIAEKEQEQAEQEGGEVRILWDGSIRQDDFAKLSYAANESNTEVRIYAKGNDYVQVAFENNL